MFICSGISPDLGEEFKGYLKKVRKVNGPLPLWLRQKIVSHQMCVLSFDNNIFLCSFVARQLTKVSYSPCEELLILIVVLYYCSRGSVSGYIPVASSNTPQSHISQPEPRCL